MTFTKIVATIGPASQTTEKISELLDAGARVFRLNLKHNTRDWHSKMIHRIRTVAKSKKINVGILLDIKGPEIRIGKFEQGHALLEPGNEITLTSKGELGNRKKIIVKNQELIESLKPGHTFYIDDGYFEFSVKKAGKEVVAKIVRGGVLHDNKSMNFPELNLEIPTIGPEDRLNVKLGIKHKVEFFALSFVRDEKDIQLLRKITGPKIQIISKIERPAAITNFDQILEASDAIMVARGDLGIEIPLHMVPIVQKMLIAKSRDSGKPVITATQMLESMIGNSRPTRAEVSDVANAIIDGTDAVMLSAESASGKYPVQAVKMMSEIDRDVNNAQVNVYRPVHVKPRSTTEAIAQAVDTLSRNPLNFKAIILLTETGRTARAIAKFHPSQPIYAYTENPLTEGQLALAWGVTGKYMSFKGKTQEKIFRDVLTELGKSKELKKGDYTICICGKNIGKENLTNSITILQV